MIDFTFDSGTYKLLCDAAERRNLTITQYFQMLSGVEELTQIKERKNEKTNNKAN
jgi:hypothetical protein